ncbi:hypothetical protein ACWD5V_10395 [Streptomyces sp. NPDC002523]
MAAAGHSGDADKRLTHTIDLTGATAADKPAPSIRLLSAADRTVLVKKAPASPNR